MAIRAGRRDGVAELGDQLESVVDRVVELNAKLNDGQAAELAGIERESMHRLLKKHGVRSEDFKPKS